MRRQSDKYQLGVLSEINVTPLIDLAFIILVIFLIAAPFLTAGNGSGRLMGGPGAEEGSGELSPPLVLSVDLGRDCRLDGVPVQWSQLPMALRDAGPADELQVVVRCHPDLPVRELVAVMGVLDNAGITAVSIDAGGTGL